MLKYCSYHDQWYHEQRPCTVKFYGNWRGNRVILNGLIEYFVIMFDFFVCCSRRGEVYNNVHCFVIFSHFLIAFTTTYVCKMFSGFILRLHLTSDFCFTVQTLPVSYRWYNNKCPRSIPRWRNRRTNSSRIEAGNDYEFHNMHSNALPYCTIIVYGESPSWIAVLIKTSGRDSWSFPHYCVVKSQLIQTHTSVR